SAKKHDMYRKPNTGMWTLMKNDIIQEFDLEKLDISKKSFFCGDAGGRIRPSILKKKMHPSSTTGDFSDTDLKFALNTGVKYITPEEFYLINDPNKDYCISGFDPEKFISSNKSKKIKYEFVPRKKELVIMVGPQ